MATRPTPPGPPADRTSTQIPQALAPTKPLHWLIPILYSATAVGVGIGLGFMAWIYRTAGVPPVGGVPSQVPIAAPKTPPVTNPNPAPNPSNPPTPGTPQLPSKVQPQLPLVPKPTTASVVNNFVIPVPNPSGAMSRAEILQTADVLARYSWTCSEANRRALCIQGVAYQSDWSANEKINGLPYNWGGADGPVEFERKLRAGLAAGSHKRHGVSRCTAGTDCSGFVAWCWGHRTGNHDFSTATLEQLATRVTGNVYNDLKPGDALNKPGSHVVLFAGYRADGGPIVYEANGAAGRVIRNDHLSWSSLAGYYPVRSNRLVDP